MTEGRTLVTGAGGYVGRRLVRALAADGRPVAALVHRPGADEATLEGAEVVAGDLLEPDPWRGALEGAATVVHLAARTGKARARDFERANVEGTRRLVEACAAAGVRRLVHVSTIAVRYPDLSRYPYAASKRDAEAIVRASGLEHAILRPTVILGPGSPLSAALGRLAGAPVMPVFGDGRAPVQPIAVDDVVRALRHLVLLPELPGRGLDLGGPEALLFEAFLRRLRAALGKSAGPAVHVPVGLLSRVVFRLEGPLLPLLPLTAGQLSAFTNDGTVRPEHDFAAFAPEAAPRVPLDGMLEVRGSDA